MTRSVADDPHLFSLKQLKAKRERAREWLETVGLDEMTRDERLLDTPPVDLVDFLVVCARLGSASRQRV